MKKTCKHAAFVAALFALAFIGCPSPTSDGGDKTYTLTRTGADIKANFGITDTTSKGGVTEAFTAVHQYIQGKSKTQIETGIKLGDYIDLVSLSVAPTAQTQAGVQNISAALRGEINATNTAITPSSLPYAGYEGKLLRLVVVGVNSFNELNGNGTTPHVVFQFQNPPGQHRMNATNTNAGGYKASEMRAYLTGNFWTGLKKAGVPDAVVWAPTRIVASKGGEDVAATDKDEITDKLWLPTEYEMSGTNTHSVSIVEMAANQASFTSYYTDDAHRIKYQSRNYVQSYYEASPYPALAITFCMVASEGNSIGCSASGVDGCAPAFCVK